MKGRDIYREMQKFHSNFEGQAEESNRRVYGNENQLRTISEEREKILVQLASSYAQPREYKEFIRHIQETLPEVQGEVERIFREKQLKRQKLDELLQSSYASKQELEARLEGVTDQLNELAAQREALQKQVHEYLVQDTQYQALAGEAQTFQKRVERCQQRVQEIDTETQEKKAKYDANKLFMYLKEQGFGTPMYSSAGIRAKLDRWVVRLTNYNIAIASYNLLCKLPEKAKEALESEEQHLQQAREAVRNHERGVAEKRGLLKVISEGQQVGKTRKHLFGERDRIVSDCQRYALERQEIDTTKSEYHQEVVQRLKAVLKSDTIAKRKERARSTPGSEDDRLVVRIEEIDREVRQLKDETKVLKAERDERQRKAEDVGKLIRRFSRQDYESDRSVFSSGFDIDMLLAGYVLGKNSQDELWGEIDSNQHFRPQETYSSSWSSPSSSSSSDSFSSGGGSDSGSFSSGDGFS